METVQLQLIVKCCNKGGGVFSSFNFSCFALCPHCHLKKWCGAFVHNAKGVSFLYVFQICIFIIQQAFSIL